MLYEREKERQIHIHIVITKYRGNIQENHMKLQSSFSVGYMVTADIYDYFSPTIHSVFSVLSSTSACHASLPGRVTQTFTKQTIYDPF